MTPTRDRRRRRHPVGIKHRLSGGRRVFLTANLDRSLSNVRPVAVQNTSGQQDLRMTRGWNQFNEIGYWR